MRLSPATRALIWVLLLAGVALFAAPLVWMVSTTMKLDHELVRRPVHWLPDTEVAPRQGPWVDADDHVHRLGLGRVFAVNSAGEQFNLERIESAIGPTDAPHEWGTGPLEDESNPALRAWDYEFDESQVADRRFGFGESLRASADLALPEGMGEIDHWIVEIRNDRSFHQMDFELRILGQSLISTPHIISSDENQDLILRHEESSSLERGDLRLSWDGNPLPHDQPDDGEITVIATLIRSTWPHALWLKFTEQCRRALVYLDFWAFTGNSVYLVILNCIGAVLASSLVAFSFARLRWHGRNALFIVLLATMMLPPQVTMVPQFLIWRSLGFYDTLVPLWLPAFLSIPFFVFLLRQFMLSIPRDLEDAARIDGCSALGIWARVILPLIKPALITVAIFQFLATWNDFMGPLIYVANPDLQPLSVGVYIFNQAFTGQWGLILAAATMMLVPVLVMFFVAQRYFIEGVTLTGLKA